MSNEAKKPNKASKSKSLSPEEVYSGFQMLRNEQRALLTKMAELETDLNEHRIVLETLKDLEGDRKCFRLVGGVLCEKTVKDVVPILSTNQEQLKILVDSFNEQIIKKGIEINEYKEKHNIRIQGQDDLIGGGGGGGGAGDESARSSETTTSDSSQNRASNVSVSVEPI